MGVIAIAVHTLNTRPDRVLHDVTAYLRSATHYVLISPDGGVLSCSSYSIAIAFDLTSDQAHTDARVPARLPASCSYALELLQHMRMIYEMIIVQK